MHKADFDYTLPEELIAQNPPEHRGDSRMMILNAKTGGCEIVPFRRIVDFLLPGDCVTLNNTRVIRARLFALKDTGAHIEIMLLRPQSDPMRWTCFLKPGKRAPEGTVLTLLHRDETPAPYTVRVVAKDPAGECVVEFAGAPVDRILDDCGHIPLPPYIKRQNLPPDAERYQTVYSKVNGSAAAPTAGLHFTPELLEKIQAKGVNIGYVTLHVGLGTVRPVKEDDIEQHDMHSEYCVIPPETATLINETKARGGRVICVGTTSCRTLESWAQEDGHMEPSAGWTSIYIYPGYRFKVMDALVTNFHLPQSTLIMLVSALAGREHVLHAYEEAVKERYRFFSFGDAMFVS